MQSPYPETGFNYDNMEEELIDRPFEEVEGGYYDGNGFYVTPEGSFWDDDGVHFNKFGLDRHGGTYDNYGMYIPGPGWNEELDCYEDEIDRNMEGNAELKKMVDDNLSKELAEDFQYYKKYFKNYDKDEISEDEPEDEEMKEVYDQALIEQNGTFVGANSNQCQNSMKMSIPVCMSMEENKNRNIIKGSAMNPNLKEITRNDSNTPSNVVFNTNCANHAGYN